MHPDVEAVFCCTAANRIGTELEELSANGGIGTYVYQFSGKASHLSHNLLGGSGQLPEALAGRLGGRIVTGATVEGVEPVAAGVRVRYTQGGAVRQLVVQAVVVATPADVARRIICGLPADLARALGAVRYGQAVLLSLLTGEERPMPYDHLYALSTPQRCFTILINVASTLRRSGQRLPGGSLLVYAGGRLARELMDVPDATVESRFLAELHRLYPETKGIVRETRVQRWDRIVPYDFPGRYRLQPLFNRAPERVFLAGDYLGNWANMEVAVATGQRAAEQVRALLEPVDQPAPVQRTV
jgi:oxygen-dependent protoporphyrinogen oxidase